MKPAAVFFILVLVLFPISGCSLGEYDQSVNPRASSTMQSQNIQETKSPDSNAPAATAGLPEQLSVDYSDSYLVESYRAGTKAEMIEQLIDRSMENKYSFDDVCFYEPANPDIAVSGYRFSPEVGVIYTYCVCLSDSGKEIRFGWYYGDIGIRLTENAIGKMTDADKYQTVTYEDQVYYYKLYQDTLSDEDDPGDDPVKLYIIWEKNHQYYELRFMNTEFSKDIIESIDQSVRFVALK